MYELWYQLNNANVIAWSPRTITLWCNLWIFLRENRGSFQAVPSITVGECCITIWPRRFADSSSHSPAPMVVWLPASGTSPRWMVSHADFPRHLGSSRFSSSGECQQHWCCVGNGWGTKEWGWRRQGFANRLAKAQAHGPAQPEDKWPIVGLNRCMSREGEERRNIIVTKLWNSESNPSSPS
jgi:hypothetical protein